MPFVRYCIDTVNEKEYAKTLTLAASAFAVMDSALLYQAGADHLWLARGILSCCPKQATLIRS